MMSRTDQDGFVSCPVCGHRMLPFGKASYCLPGPRRVDTDVLSSRACGLLKRDSSGIDLEDHYSVASYTSLANEARFHAARIGFFESLWRLAQRTARAPIKRCLDFGCSYGHFPALMEKRGCDVVGIEVADEPRDLCRRKGFKVYKQIEEIPEEATFDLVTAIDSIYYLDDSLTFLQHVGRHLAKHGTLLLRVTNRNWIARVLKVLGKDHYGNWLGDGTLFYSARSLRRILESGAFSIHSEHYWERGKQMPQMKKALYCAAAAVSWATLGSLILAPGITVLAGRSNA